MERLDNSRLRAVATCSTQCAMHYCFHMVGKEEPAPRRMGSDGHKAMAEYFVTGDGERAVARFLAEYAEWAKANVAVDDRLAVDNVETILREWVRTHPLEKMTFVVAGEPEQAVVMELDEGTEFWALVDLPVREKATGGLYVLDHKFTGRITDWWTRQFRLGSQMTGYIAALAKASGEVVTGAYINAVEVGKLPTPGRKCAVHRVDYGECRAAHAKWQLLTTTRSAEALRQWQTDAKGLAAKFRAIKRVCTHIDMVGYLPQEGRFNGGCTFCDLRDFCSAGRQVNLVEQMLVYSPWFPWEKKEAEL